MAGEATAIKRRVDDLETCKPPEISNDELFAFYQAHFSNEAVAQFGEAFLSPGDGTEARKNNPYDEEWEEDDLGYYDDGVKRTLTDEQIAIFRHSELRELRRQQERHAVKPKDKVDANAAVEETRDSEGASSLHEAALPSSFRGNKKRKKKGANRPKPEPKPDLRKRTWDVVDKGLDSLDYD